MKAVVVEIDGKYAVALDKKGNFIKINNDGKLRIGYEVDVPSAKIFNLSTYLKPASIAASFLLLIGISYGAYSYSNPYSYVDIDINPSIEFTTNVYDRIIKAEGLNEDGKKLLEKNNFKNQSLKDGVEGVIKNAANEGYIKEDVKNAVMVTVSSKDDKKAEKIEEEAKTAVNKEIKNEKAETDVLVEKVNIQRHDEALKQGISPGRLLLIERLRETNPEVKVEDAKKLPVREILKQINKNKKEIKRDERQDSPSNKHDDNNEKLVPPGQLKKDEIKNKIKDRIKDDKEKLQDKAKEVKDKIKGKNDEIKDEIKNRTDEIKKDFKDKIIDTKIGNENSLRDKLEEIVNESKSNVDEAVDNIKDNINDNSSKTNVPSNKGSSGKSKAR